MRGGSLALLAWSFGLWAFKSGDSRTLFVFSFLYALGCLIRRLVCLKTGTTLLQEKKKRSKDIQVYGMGWCVAAKADLAQVANRRFWGQDTSVPVRDD